MWEGVRSAAAWTGAGPEGQGGSAGFTARPAGDPADGAAAITVETRAPLLGPSNRRR